MVRCCGRILQKFREKFTYPTADVTHFYPSHMASGLKRMQEHLKNVDCLLEIHDARIPLSGRNPVFKDTLMIRPHVLILNKRDLTDMTHADKMRQVLMEEEAIQSVVFTQCVGTKTKSLKETLIPTILEAIQGADRFSREGLQEYNVMILGVPNVGKSLLINKLRQMHLQSKTRGMQVASHAGTTKSVHNRTKIHKHPTIFVYDTPGILLPRLTNKDTAMKLALCGSLRDDMIGQELIVDYLLFWFNKHQHFYYVKHYGLSEPTDDIMSLLAHIARQHKLVKRIRTPKGLEHRPDFNFTAKMVLDDFRTGKLGRYILDEDILRKQTGNQKVAPQFEHNVNEAIT